MSIFIINNPIGSGGISNSDTVAYSFYQNSNIKVPQFLKTVDQNYSNVNPQISDRTGTIQTVVVSNEVSELDQFAVSVYVNGVQQYTNTKPAGSARIEFTGLSIPIAIGDALSVRVYNMLAPIENPRCVLILRGT